MVISIETENAFFKKNPKSSFMFKVLYNLEMKISLNMYLSLYMVNL